MKTKTDSYKLNNLCRGCKLCLKGQKLVLFVGGKCSRNCWYCSLSEGRKNSPQMWANEKPCETNQDIIQEAIDSNATGAGITGGDPLVYLDKTTSAAKALKIKFGKKFHIHIYLPLPLVDKTKLEKLASYIDEIRFHPSFLINPDESLMQEEIEKIKLASQIFGKQNTGIELPLLPEKKKEIIEFIKQIEPYISFVNLNEFELSDTNFDIITKDYTLNEDTYTIHGSIEAGKEILKKFKSTDLNIHLCTAKTKNHHQYHNRLLLHNILPYGVRTEEATVVYFTIIPKDMKETIQKLKQYTKHFHIDSRHNRILLKESEVQKLYNTKEFEINLCEEHPTYDAEKTSFWKITEEDFN
ncbi:MAG: radical SAM protein [Candidatus Omnitrophica bacterium]|nr:radical SAM protein [Candidatus Omnitrophota bacterium]